MSTWTEDRLYVMETLRSVDRRAAATEGALSKLMADMAVVMERTEDAKAARKRRLAERGGIVAALIAAISSIIIALVGTS